MRIRIAVLWDEAGDIDRFALRLSMLLSAMRGIDPDLSGWSFKGPEGEPVPAADKDACRRALELARRPWRTGATARVAYRPKLWVDAPLEPRARQAEPEHLGQITLRPPPPAPGERAAELYVRWGFSPVGDVPAYLPNMVTLLLHPGLGSMGVDRKLVERLLSLCASTFKPDWGVAGGENRPQLPVAPFGDGAPAVGWMTYLSSRHPPLPVLPEPAVTRQVGTQGTVVIADQALRYAERDPAQAEHIDRVRNALRAAGVLIDAATLRRVQTAS